MGRNYVAHMCDDLWLSDLTNVLLSEEISVNEQLILVRDLMFVDGINSATVSTNFVIHIRDVILNTPISRE